MTEINTYIQAHWVAWIFALLSMLIGVLYRKLDKIAKRNKAIGGGVQAMLRSEIIDKYNYYKNKGHCPIYAKDNVKRLYEPYKDLDGNGVIEKLVDGLLNMSTERGDIDD